MRLVLQVREKATSRKVPLNPRETRQVLSVVTKQLRKSFLIAAFILTPESYCIQTIHPSVFASMPDTLLNPLLPAHQAVLLAYPSKVKRFELAAKIQSKLIVYDANIKAVPVVCE